MRLVDDKQPGEVQVAPVQEVERSGLDQMVVQYVDFVRLAIGDVDETGNGAAQIEQCVQHDGRLGAAKRRPRIDRQTQIAGGRRIEGVDRSIQIQSKGLVGIQRTRNADQMLGEVGIDLPRPCRIGVRQRVARNRRTSEPQVVEPPGLRTQIDFDVAQGLAVGKLRKGHRQQLVEAAEILDHVLAPVSSNEAAKCAQCKNAMSYGNTSLP